ncbi:MAG: putative rRNA methyltransferase YqxC [Candidatus Saccharibacteria bacterium]|nr:putative rRNA methyltransferase YqxC [Candidatus Saccharibacteria bacterium]MDB5180646.1 putative rRNA methyltransferase YqxC [Candidatus Saccharibacteria bacterium]
MKQRLDAALTTLGLAPTRSQAESVIKLGEVTVNGQVITKPGHFVSENSLIDLLKKERYVSRAGLKLASVAELLKLDFRDKTVLDVGSSTGGFTDYSLKHGASKVFAVDVGTEQLHPSLRKDKRIELHEKTDIRDFRISAKPGTQPVMPDIIVIDVSFISLREILPHIARELSDVNTKIVAMVKPQFEAGRNQTNKGIIKNDSMRRQILKNFEIWSKDYFFIVDKRDSDVSGAKGNQERFYLLTLNRNSTTSPGRIT